LSGNRTETYGKKLTFLNKSQSVLYQFN